MVARGGANLDKVIPIMSFRKPIVNPVLDGSLTFCM